ncbi:hypothetical protein M413DRAFT_322950 [Hebeloma cylindrosporum]|uniref:Uncharacterized protein n=1 Tax=Hebeloma cylindrosporum TaxID=76867 RepID=A0A0C2Y4J2_HEBCY|nr:hypothetical protein M413DRAFT_322950 [Hebeloma cylindrosporum h7]
MAFISYSLCCHRLMLSASSRTELYSFESRFIIIHRTENHPEYRLRNSGKRSFPGLTYIYTNHRFSKSVERNVWGQGQWPIRSLEFLLCDGMLCDVYTGTTMCNRDELRIQSGLYTLCSIRIPSLLSSRSGSKRDFEEECE